MAEADKEMEKWLVSDKTCKGCMYYGRIGGHSGKRCCDYTYLTGRFRKNPPATCEVKKKGIRPVLSRDTDYLSPRLRKGGVKRG